MELRTEPVIWTSEDNELLTDPGITKEIWPNGIDNNPKFYQRQGFMKIPSLIPQMDVFSANYLAYSLKRKEFDGTILESNGKSVRSVFNVQQNCPELVKLLYTKKIYDYARLILGSDVYIHQFHINYKSAFYGGGFFWHSDYTFWHWDDGMPSPRALSFVIPLDKVGYLNSPTYISPGSHMYYGHSHYFRDQENSVESSAEEDIKHDEHDLGSATDQQLRSIGKFGMTPLVGQEGDVFIMDANMLHMSMPNYGFQDRPVAFLCLNSVDNLLEEPYSGRARRPEYLTTRDVDNNKRECFV